MDSKQGGKAQKSHAGAFSELVTTIIAVPSTSTSQKEKKKLVRHEHTHTVPLIKCMYNMAAVYRAFASGLSSH